MFDDKGKIPSPDVKWFCRKRYYVASLVFYCNIVHYFVVSNLHIAIVEIASDKHIIVGNETYIQRAEFEWRPVEKGYFLSAYSWGSLFAPLGGFLTDKYGGANVFGFGLIVAAFLTALSPILIRLNIIAFIISRVIEGLNGSCTLVAVTDIFFHWVPPNERARLISNTIIGSWFGAVISPPICSYMIKYFGWEIMFFIIGGIAAGSSVVWFILVKNSPEQDRIISRTEQEYLKENVIVAPNKIKTYPWKQILTSKPVWALLNERFVEAWALSFTLVCLPLYIKDVTNLSIENIGLVSSIPNVSPMLGLFVGSYIADYLRNNKIMNISNVHKLFITTSHISTIIGLILMSLWMNFTATIVLLCLIRLCYAVSTVSYGVLPMDLALQYSNIVVSLCWLTFSCGMVLNPIVLGYMVSNHSVWEWKKYFTFLCVFNIWGSVIFCVFGSGDVQPWAVSSPKESDGQRDDNEMKVKSRKIIA